MIESSSCFVKKIIELKNVDIFQLFYYGLQHKFVDGEVCSQIAGAMMNMGFMGDNPYILQLASLLPQEYARALSIINQAIEQDEIEKHQKLYNKVWFYLFQVSDLCRNNII